MKAKIRFTKAALDALPRPPAGKRAEYWDSAQQGLQIRVTPTGVKTFYVKRRVKSGPVERLMLGRYPGMKIERARSKAAALVGKLIDGDSPAAARRAVKAEPTFAALFTEYVQRHAKPNKRTWREDEQRYRDYLAKPLGEKKISQINRRDIANIHSKVTRDRHPTTANRVKDLLSSIFGRAIGWGYIEDNPAKGVADNPEKSRDRFLRPNELPRLFISLAQEPNQTFRDYFLMALLTGARRENVRTMSWRNIELEPGVWHIPVTKNGVPQHVPLVPEAIKILRARMPDADEPRGYVFASLRSDSRLGHITGERRAWLRVLDRDELTQLVQRIEAMGATWEKVDGESLPRGLVRARALAAKLKIKTEGARMADVRIHDLRRTLGSWQARTGASMVVIGKSLGHKSQQATAVYARLDIDPVRQAMETATSAMLTAGGLKPRADIENIKRRKAKR